MTKKKQSTKAFFKLSLYQRMVISLVVVSSIVMASAFVQQTKQATFYSVVVEDSFSHYSSDYNIRVPKGLTFAGEAVPLNKSKVKERFAKQLARRLKSVKKSTLLHKRADRHFPAIQAILSRYGIPDDFKYLTLVESTLDTSVVSSRGAAGVWQIMPETAIELGLIVNDTLDERTNILKSTKVACKYFRRSYKVFNNWTLVAASYNRGINGIERQIKKQAQNSYYDLSLSKETDVYIYKTLVMKEIVSRPLVYGFKY